jgi:hypothetical protein
MSGSDEVDFIVVGGGSAGSVVGQRHPASTAVMLSGGAVGEHDEVPVRRLPGTPPVRLPSGSAAGVGV